MLSIVPLMQVLFETGAGGSALNTLNNSLMKDTYVGTPWEIFSFAVSLEHLGSVYNNPKALVLAEALDQATDKF
jgi:isocitrate dehydrogenase